MIVMDYAGAYPKPRKPPQALTLFTETGPVELNDKGRFGDAQAKDGILSGVGRVDRARHDSDISAFVERARILDRSSAPLFNLRQRVGSKPFDLADPLVGRGAPRELRFTLPPFGLVTVIATPLPHLPLDIPPTTNVMRTVAMTHVGVVQDVNRTFAPCTPTGVIQPYGNMAGPWSFQTLVGNMSGSTNATVRQAFISNWLKTWHNEAPPNTVKHFDGPTVPFAIQGRTALKGAVSTFQDNLWDQDDPTSLVLAKLPFRLLGIFNRIDLAGQSAYGPTNSAEIRFVFGLLKKTGPTSCAPSDDQLTVILEYAVPSLTCTALRTSAQGWKVLDNFDPADPQYRALLEIFTNTVTLINANPTKPNGSAIGQVRTNEVALGLPWELREWRIDGPLTGAALKPNTVKDTPDAQFNFTPAMNGITLGGVPISLVASSIQYGPTSNPPNPPWDSSPVWEMNKRFEISNKTCSGCHEGETLTDFTMVKSNGPLNIAAELAAFMTGSVGVPDLVYPGLLTHDFDDLNRRAVMLDQMAVKSCHHLTAIRNTQFKSVKVFQPMGLQHWSAFSPPFVH